MQIIYKRKHLLQIFHLRIQLQICKRLHYNCKN